MNNKQDLITVMFQTRNRKQDVINCINSINQSSYKNIEIIICDNGSTDGTSKMIKKDFPEVILIESLENLGIPKSFNKCIEISHGKYLLRLDDDVLLDKYMIENMYKVLITDDKIGATGCLYFYTEEPDIMRASGMEINLFTGKTYIYDRDKVYQNQYDGKVIERNVIGGVLLIRKETYNKIGNCTEEYFFSYEDIDLCFKIRKLGLKIMLVGDAKLYHKRGGGLSKKESKERVYFNRRSQIIFIKKFADWRKIIYFPYLFLVIFPIKFLKYFIQGNLDAIDGLSNGVKDGIKNKLNLE